MVEGELQQEGNIVNVLCSKAAQLTTNGNYLQTGLRSFILEMESSPLPWQHPDKIESQIVSLVKLS
ncbi:MAG: hypothetical protein ABI690_36165, partial [Chloroflexota bacterium]